MASFGNFHKLTFNKTDWVAATARRWNTMCQHTAAFRPWNAATKTNRNSLQICQLWSTPSKIRCWRPWYTIQAHICQIRPQKNFESVILIWQKWPSEKIFSCDIFYNISSKKDLRGLLYSRRGSGRIMKLSRHSDGSSSSYFGSRIWVFCSSTRSSRTVSSWPPLTLRQLRCERPAKKIESDMSVIMVSICIPKIAKPGFKKKTKIKTFSKKSFRKRPQTIFFPTVFGWGENRGRTNRQFFWILQNALGMH